MGLHYPDWHDDAYNDFAWQCNEEIDTLTRLRDNVWSGEGGLIAKHSTGGGSSLPQQRSSSIHMSASRQTCDQSWFIGDSLACFPLSGGLLSCGVLCK